DNIVGRWLIQDGQPLDIPQTVAAVDAYGGNADLARRAVLDHPDHLDKWEVNGVDVEAIVGIGLSPAPSVEGLPKGAGHQALKYGDGDGVTPRDSATLAGGGAQTVFVCDRSSFQLATDASVLELATTFAETGQPAADSDSACPASGKEIAVNAKQNIPAIV